MLARTNDPFLSLSREMSRIFNAPTLARPTTSPARCACTPSPAIDMWADDTALHVEADLPGVALDDIEVTATADEIVIRGTRVIEVDEHTRVLRGERPAGNFERTIPLPFDINVDNVRASLTNGVLSLDFAKSAQHEPTRITVTSA